jgi:biopolymer transport protein ExbB
MQMFLQKIGIMGIFLLFLSVFGLYLSFKNSLFLHFVGKEFRGLMRKMDGAVGKLKAHSWNINNPLINVVQNIIQSHGAHSQDLRAEVAYLFHRNFEKVNRDITYLRLVSVVSPLLGLLGTVLGMVKVFQALAKTTNPEPALLAAGIWQALITTIMGLCVAVPCLFFYYHLSLKMKGFRIEAVEYSYQILNLHQQGNSAAKPKSVVAAVPDAVALVGRNN